MQKVIDLNDILQRVHKQWSFLLPKENEQSTMHIPHIRVQMSSLFNQGLSCMCTYCIKHSQTLLTLIVSQIFKGCRKTQNFRLKCNTKWCIIWLHVAAFHSDKLVCNNNKKKMRISSCNHNIIQIQYNVMWDWLYSTKYSQTFLTFNLNVRNLWSIPWILSVP